MSRPLSRPLAVTPCETNRRRFPCAAAPSTPNMPTPWHVRPLTDVLAPHRLMACRSLTCHHSPSFGRGRRQLSEATAGQCSTCSKLATSARRSQKSAQILSLFGCGRRLPRGTFRVSCSFFCRLARRLERAAGAALGPPRARRGSPDPAQGLTEGLRPQTFHLAKDQAWVPCPRPRGHGLCRRHAHADVGMAP